METKWLQPAIHTFVWAYLVFGLLVFVFTNLLGQLPPTTFRNFIRGEDMMVGGGNFWAMTEDEYGFIWIGNVRGSGLYRFDGYDFKYYMYDPNRPGSLGDNKVYEMESFWDGKIYVGTIGDLNVYDITTDQISQVFNVPIGGTNYFYSTVDAVAKNEKGEIWLGTFRGLLKYLPETDTLFGNTTYQGQIRFHIWDLINDRNHAELLWVAAEEGLFSFNTETNTLTRIQLLPSGSRISDPEILSLFQDEDDWVWVAGLNGYLYAYHPNSGIIKIYNIISPEEEKEIPSDTIYYIAPRNRSELWLATSRQVGIFQKKTAQFNAYNSNPGNLPYLLPSEEHWFLLIDRHGILWVGNDEGFSRSWQKVGLSHDLPLPPKVYLTDIKINDQPFPVEDNLLFLDTLTLDENQNYLQVTFVLPNPYQPEEVQYRYHLKGIDEKWRTGYSRAAYYENLPGGTFLFQVQAREKGGDWTEPLELAIVIDQPFYNTFNFKASIAGGLLFLLIGAFFLRIRQTRKEEQLKMAFQKQLSEAESKALRAQINPAFLFKNLSAIRRFIFRDEKEKAAVYLTRFARLMRYILKNSNEHFVALSDDLEALRLQLEFEVLQHENLFRYEIYVDPDIEKEKAWIPPAVLQFFVEMLVQKKFLPHRDEKGQLTIDIRKNNGTLISTLTLKKNQPGRIKALNAQPTNTGQRDLDLETIKERLAYLKIMYGLEIPVEKTELLDNDDKVVGSKVIIYFPTLIN